MDLVNQGYNDYLKGDWYFNQQPQSSSMMTGTQYTTKEDPQVQTQTFGGLQMQQPQQQGMQMQSPFGMMPQRSMPLMSFGGSPMVQDQMIPAFGANNYYMGIPTSQFMQGAR